MPPTKIHRTQANTTIRLPQSIDNMWTGVAEKLHISKTTACMLAIKAFAEQHGIKEQPVEEDEAHS